MSFDKNQYFGIECHCSYYNKYSYEGCKHNSQMGDFGVMNFVEDILVQADEEERGRGEWKDDAELEELEQCNDFMFIPSPFQEEAGTNFKGDTKGKSTFWKELVENRNSSNQK